MESRIRVFREISYFRVQVAKIVARTVARICRFIVSKAKHNLLKNEMIILQVVEVRKAENATETNKSGT